jgi:pimeloyl-ACP methyl ester carboxylesterase
MEALSVAGFRCIALDLRGYNQSQRPTSWRDYALPLLVDDVASVVRALGGQAHVVAHDWGGIIAYAFAGRYPQLVDRLAILNAPHAGVYRRRALMPPQIFKSWYVGFFGLPGHVAEAALSANDFAGLRRIFRRGILQKDAFSEAQIDEYVGAMKQPGALTAALNYYRAGLWLADGMRIAERAHVSAPTMVLWGTQDIALDVSLLEGLGEFVPNLTVKTQQNSGHFIQNEIPNFVNDQLLDFLRTK